MSMTVIGQVRFKIYILGVLMYDDYNVALDWRYTRIIAWPEFP